MPLSKDSLCFIFCMCVIFSLSGCISTENVSELNTEGSSEQPAADTAVVKLAVPENVSHSFFSYSDPSILADLETGSPSSLRSAAAKIRKSNIEYTETDKVLLAVAGAVMQIVWPDAQITWDLPVVADTNPYTGAVASARMGVYDVNTGRTDFLTLVLPSLVLLTSPSRDDFFAEAENDLQNALALNSQSVLARYLLGLLYYRQQRYSMALEQFSAAEQLDASCLRVRYMKAMTCLAVGNSREAYNIGLELQKQYPQNIDILKLCAESSFILEDYDRAEAFVAQVLQKEPEISYYVLFRVRILVKKEDFIRAASLLDVYGRTDKTSRDYLLLRSQIQQQWNKNSAAAAATIEEALVRYPEDTTVILAAAELADETGRLLAGKSAGELAAQILVSDADNIDALSVSVNAAIKEQQWKLAYDTNAHLMSLLAPEIPLAVSLKHIDICIMLDYLSEAYRLAQALYSADSENEDICTSYLKVLFAQGRTGEVLQIINNRLPKATQTFKSFLYYQRGILQKNNSDRLADLRLSLTSNPRNADALFQLYRYYFEQQDFRKAQYYLRQAVALNPDDQKLLELTAELDSLIGR